MAVPDDLRYRLLPSAPGCRTYISQIYPSNGSKYSWNSKIVIEIPTGSPATWLVPHESLLQFTFHNPTASTVRFDAGAHSLFQRLEIFHGPSLVESIAEVNTLTDLLLNAQMPLDQRTGPHARVSGGNVDTAGGEVLYATRVNYALWGREIDAGGTYTAAIQLPSSLVGCCASKYLPLALMGGSDVRIELTLTEAGAALYSQDDTFEADAGSMYIDDVKFVAQISEIETRADEAISNAAESNGSVVWHSTQWRNYISSVPEEQTYANIQIPARFSSLNALIMCFKPAENVANRTARSASTETANLSQYQLRIGPNVVPSQPIKYSPTNFAEVIPATNEAFGISRSAVSDTGITWLSETIASKADLSGEEGYRGATFCFGLTTSSFQGATESLLNSGANTISQLIFAECWFDEGTPSALRVFTFAQFDVLYTLNDGLLSVRF